MSVCLITGGASGIGLECGKSFLQQNTQNKLSIVDLVIPYQVESELLKQYGNDRLLFLKTDVTKHQEIFQAFKDTADKFKRIDLVLNNAGVGLKEDFIHKDEQQLMKAYQNINKVIEINLNAVIKVTMLSIMFMKQLQTPGQIINVASMGGILPQGDAPAYSASKHGVIGFSRSLQYLYKEEGIRINTMCPSFIETPLVISALSQKIGRKIHQGELIKLGIAMHTDVVVKAFLQMINDKHQNGQVITIQPGNRINRKKYPPIIRMPGESERGGALVRIPSETELKEFKDKLKFLKTQKNPKL